MPAGTPTMEAVAELETTDFYQDLLHYNEAFRGANERELRGYARFWGDDAMKLWSRRWEYPFAAAKVLDHADRLDRDDLAGCDAGSGVTFLPYYLADRLPQTTFVCCDTNPAYAKMFDAVNNTADHDRVSFRNAAASSLPFDDGQLDVLCCVSVLEHTDAYSSIINEFARVLKPGGRLVLTFDLSLGGSPKFQLTRQSAGVVFDTLASQFDTTADELWAMAKPVYDHPDGRLTTNAVRATQPELLPWKYPKIQAIYDVLRGYGWTGGFRPVAAFCLDLARTA